MTSEYLSQGFSFSTLKHTIIRHTTLNLTKKNSLLLILIFTTIAIFDSAIVRFSAYTGLEPPTEWGLSIIISFFIVFIVFGTVLLNSLKKIVSTYKPSAPRGLRYFHILTTSAFVLTLVIGLSIILQIIILNKYSLVLLSAQTYLSHLTSFISLSFLVYLFVRWLISSRRNVIVMLFAISCSLLGVNLIVSLLYLSSYYSSSLRSERSWYPIISIVINHRASPFTQSLSATFDFLSLSSYLGMWIATSILLSQYRHRMGRIKYISIMSVPLVYYIFPFQNYFGGLLFPWLLYSPATITILYITIFSATKQVGAFVFSLSFWTSSELLYDTQVRKAILLSAIGITILFGSLQVTPLQYRIYPPYGVITQAFLPLGAYLLLAGIYISATYISQDSKLRKEFYKSAASQLRLLGSIGVSEMERELEKRVKTLANSPGFSEDTDRWELKEEDVKQTLQDVLKEVYSKRKDTDLGDGR
jgi:hypothetical protein